MFIHFSFKYFLILKSHWPSIDPKTGKLNNLSNPASQRALDVFITELAHIIPSQQAQLATKYSDAVVYSHSHLVQDHMGHLNISCAAETLQAAKTHSQIRDELHEQIYDSVSCTAHSNRLVPRLIIIIQDERPYL